MKENSMNEKEKNAIEEFRKQLRLAINIDDVTTAIRNDNAKTILNLIEKLQKENEELKRLHIQDNKHLDFIMEHSISVQKVKDKIEELNRKINNGGKTYERYGGCVINSENIMKLQNQIEALQELLEGRK